MKPFFIITLLWSCVSCSESIEKGSTTFSTVDSNTLSKDSIPATIYLDNAKQDTFPMAMDSAGPTIEPQDTAYKKPGG